MQQNPLLEQLDWFFTSVNWTNEFPMIEVTPLAKITSDHIPCKIMINTSIPKSNLFRFESFWTEHSDFLSVVGNSWNQNTQHPNSENYHAAKFKRLRYALKSWSKSFSNLNLLISNCNIVILFLDTLEDRRELFNTERNLRSIVKDQMEKLLNYKRLYWKSRYTVNRIKLGDECTKFFQAMATISYRRNSIRQLTNEDGAVITDHAGKADLIWSSFRGRMGVTTNPTMVFDLFEIVTPHEDLSSLVVPFSKPEIDRIVRRMPRDKALGPNGFNGHFIKKCWQLIRMDFYQLCMDFYNSQANLESINDSLITLVTKTLNLETVNDFRPISLLNPKL